MSIILFLVILLVLVLIHEFGHFFSAKKFGIRVDEFGFGFPPKVLSVKMGETEYSLNLLPIGGFVRIFGENPDEDSLMGPDSSRSFVNKPAWQQAVVLAAGVFMNFLLASILFSIGFMSGLPTAIGSEPSGSNLTDIHTVVVAVVPNSPAEQAGLKSGDKILYLKSGTDYLNDQNSLNPSSIKTFVSKHKEEDIDLGYTRGKSSDQIHVKIHPQSGLIGINMDEVGTAKISFFKSIKEGFILTCYVIKGTIFGLFGLIKDGLHGSGSLASVTGPVGMVGIVGDAYKFGFIYLLSFAALISVNLGVINLLPFPALDGGRLFFLLIEKIKGSRMNAKIVNTINLVSFFCLILLMVVITYHDIVKILAK